MGRAYDKTMEELEGDVFVGGAPNEGEWNHGHILRRLHHLERKVTALVADLTGVEAAVTTAIASEQAGAVELGDVVQAVKALQETAANGGTITQAQLDTLAASLGTATTALTTATTDAEAAVTPAPAPAPTPEPTPAPTPEPTPAPVEPPVA